MWVHQRGERAPWTQSFSDQDSLAFGAVFLPMGSQLAPTGYRSRQAGKENRESLERKSAWDSRVLQSHTSAGWMPAHLFRAGHHQRRSRYFARWVWASILGILRTASTAHVRDLSHFAVFVLPNFRGRRPGPSFRGGYLIWTSPSVARIGTTAWRPSEGSHRRPPRPVVW